VGIMGGGVKCDFCPAWPLVPGNRSPRRRSIVKETIRLVDSTGTGPPKPGESTIVRDSNDRSWDMAKKRGSRKAPLGRAAALGHSATAL